MAGSNESIRLSDPSVPVVVLSLSQHGAVGIMRSLGRLGVAVYGVHYDVDPPSARSRFCRGLFPWDLTRAPREDSIQFLLEVGKKLGSRPILIPTSDLTATFVAENAGELRNEFRFPNLSAELVHSLGNKKGMYFTAKRLGIPTAEVIFPQNRSDVIAAIERVTFPLMLKAIENAPLLRRTGLRMVVVENPEELLQQYDLLEDPENPNLMLQEYIPGEDDTIWMFNGYFNEQSECLIGFTGRKIHQYPVHTGMTSLGILLTNPTIAETTKKLMKDVGYRGILDLGYRFDARDGQYKLLDVNPRIGATFRLFVATNGMDVARALYMDLTGQPVPPSEPREGRKWMVLSNDLRALRDYRNEHSLTVRQWLRSLRGVEEMAWVALDDPVPFFAVLRPFLQDSLRLFRRKLPGFKKRGQQNRATSIPASPENSHYY